ncbi:MAG: TIGR00296 family protein [Candidatus Thermoplasmatota archaeon]
MLNQKEGIEIVKLARMIIENTVKNNPFTIPEKYKILFQDKQGVFVTIHTYPNHDLRGCIGIPLPVMPLYQAVIEAATSVTHDPRFPRLEADEIDHIIIEVTILTKPELIKVKQPREYLSHIVIGRDGLIVEQGYNKGLLLPQVPVEQNWNKEEFLSHTCMKAGLLPDAWFEHHTKIFKFSGQIFTETTPKGEIKEKKLDGSNN